MGIHNELDQSFPPSEATTPLEDTTYDANTLPPALTESTSRFSFDTPFTSTELQSQHTSGPGSAHCLVATHPTTPSLTFLPYETSSTTEFSSDIIQPETPANSPQQLDFGPLLDWHAQERIAESSISTAHSHPVPSYQSNRLAHVSGLPTFPSHYAHSQGLQSPSPYHHATVSGYINYTSSDYNDSYAECVYPQILPQGSARGRSQQNFYVYGNEHRSESCNDPHEVMTMTREHEQQPHPSTSELSPPTQSWTILPSKSRQQPRSLPVPVRPPVQNWSVGLSQSPQQPSSHVQPKSRNNNYDRQIAEGPSYHSNTFQSQLPIDKKSRLKQEAYRMKGEILRRHKAISNQKRLQPSYSASSTVDTQSPKIRQQKKTKPATSRSSRRKCSSTDDDAAQPPNMSPGLHHASSPTVNLVSDYALTPNEVPCVFLYGYDAPFPATETFAVTQTTQSCEQHVSSLPGLEIEPSHLNTDRPLNKQHQDLEDLDQALNVAYEEYKWSVKLYKMNVDKTGYKFALLWLEDQLATLDYLFSHKWFAHTSEGFLQDGNHLTFLVLHNAANPFEFQTHVSTTTFGYHESSVDSINWTTIAPGLRSLIDVWVTEGSIELAQKWHIDMLPKEKRFHRAYWKAANMLPLEGLLNRAPVDESQMLLPRSSSTIARNEHIEIPMDEPENIEVDSNNDDPGDDDDAPDLDISNELGIDIPIGEAQSTWQQCLDYINGDTVPYSPPSGAIGSSELIFPPG